MSETVPPGAFVVDDNPAIRRMLARVLEADGLDVESFESAESFLAAGGATRQGCLVLDLVLPGMDGLDLLAELNRAGSTLAVLVLTGHASVQSCLRALRLGVVDFVEKPFDPAALVARIRAALRVGGAREAERARRDAMAARLACLSDRERGVLEGLVAGVPNKQIAAQLDICERTVERARSGLMEKLGVQSLADLVRQYLELTCR